MIPLTNLQGNHYNGFILVVLQSAPLTACEVSLLNHAKSLGGQVIVPMTGKDIVKRSYILENLKSVDYVVEGSLVDAITHIRPRTLACGHIDKNTLGQDVLDVCEKYNVKIQTGLGEKEDTKVDKTIPKRK
jgi:hypothetical protein